MSQATQSTAGKIVYRTEVVRNPSYRGAGGAAEYSEPLRALIRRDNVPERRTVYFDGTRSRTEEINFDYGVKSPAIRLREAGRATLYCKELPHVHFCVEQPELASPTGPSPSVQLTDEQATIGGHACRKAIHDNLSQKQELYFTEQLHVEDATGAVYRVDGVPGLIVQWQPVGDPRAELIERVTVVETSFARPAAALFAPPAGFRKVASVDEARAEERRLRDAEAAQHPPTAEDRARFVGRWRLATAPDDLRVEVVQDGDAYVLRTTHGGQTSDERATIAGGALVVDDPPNVRVYRTSADGDQLLLVGSEAFRFQRVR